MLSESHPLIRMALRFLALPYCYFKLVNWKECTASRLQVLKDLFYIFFKLKYFPYNYSPCRLWEKTRKEWHFYYGSIYEPYQRNKLRKQVQRFEYVYLFDNKEITEILCRGMEISLPAYYGVVWPEMNYREKISKAVFSNKRSKVIIKPVMGQGGADICIAYYDGKRISVKIEDKEVNLTDFSLKERSILQEVVVQHEDLAAISRPSVNTIRVVTLFTKSEETIIIGTYVRFGVNNAYLDNVSAGGIEVGIDKKTGRLKKIAYDKYGRMYTKHPTSNVIFEGIQIPYWGKVIQLAKSIQERFSFYKLLGLDIAVLRDGPLLIEINPNPDIIGLEMVEGPILKNERTYNEFAKYDLFVNKFQKNLYERF